MAASSRRLLRLDSSNLQGCVKRRGFLLLFLLQVRINTLGAVWQPFWLLKLRWRRNWRPALECLTTTVSACSSFKGGVEHATSMQPFLSRLVRYWSKETNGTRPGGQNNKFFNSRISALPWAWRARRCNPVNPRRRGVPGVAKGRYYTRASAYTARAAASIGGYI